MNRYKTIPNNGGEPEHVRARGIRACLQAGLLIAIGYAPVTMAISDADLQARLQQRLTGDRSGACLAVAVIDGRTARGVVCADPNHPRSIDADSVFEIGSISKTMIATLLAAMIADQQLTLDDPLASHLPAAHPVPSHDGQAITLRHLLTHRSGLPSIAPSWRVDDPRNPYRRIDERQLLRALDTLVLTRAPGSQFEYSNFAAMLLSTAIANVAGADIEALLATRLFKPLGMQSSFVARAGKGARRLQGHLPTGAKTPAWDFAGNAAGAGGVRASLNDMVRFLEAQLGHIDTPLAAAIASTQQEITVQDGPRMGMGWMITRVEGQDVYFHEGETGGFSSLVAFTSDHSRGVVILSDTALGSLGGLGPIGMHLLNERVSAGAPRTLAAAPAGLIDALVGRYRLAGGLLMEVRRDGDELGIQASGQPAYAMAFDSAGDFFPRKFDAVLRPWVRDDGSAGFTWLQGGAVIPASRVEPKSTGVGIDAAPLTDYTGRYPLRPGLILEVFTNDSMLTVQPTGQAALPVESMGQDRFRADEVGVEIQFNRNDHGKVDALTLTQGGQVLHGARQ